MGLVRSSEAPSHLTTFVVAGVCTVLITRAFLALAGYPQIGGRGLHVAHMLPGGLLMLVAQFLLLSYVGPGVRPAAALVGGVGFGLFIDEIGKFVTADNDYFYQPAAALMYALFALLVLAVRAVHGRRIRDPREYLANAVDQAVDGVAGGLSHRGRVRAAAALAAAVPDDDGPSPRGLAETRALLARCSADELELPSPVAAGLAALRRGFTAAAAARWVTRAIVVLLVVQALAAQGLFLALNDGEGVALVGVLAGSVLSASFTVRGALRLRRDRTAAFRLFQHALLVSLLVTQVFQFAASEFGAVGGLLFDLGMLGLVSAEVYRLERADRASA